MAYQDDFPVHGAELLEKLVVGGQISFPFLAAA